MRKAKWLVPYMRLLDNWKVELHDMSDVGLMQAQKVAPRPSGKSQNQARLRLLKMRCNPVEIAAATLPSKLCGIILGLLPKRFALRLSDGR
jgi:hypothetical protein